MLDNALIQLFLPIVQAGLIDHGFTGVVVVANFQPTQEGRVDGSAVYFNKVGPDHRYGSPQHQYAVDVVAQTCTRTTTQMIESHWQFDVAINDDPNDVNSKTGPDLARAVAMILQDPDTVYALKRQKVGIERITDVRNTYVQNDRAQYEANPSFDAIITHQDVFTKNVNFVTSISGTTKSV